MLVGSELPAFEGFNAEDGEAELPDRGLYGRSKGLSSVHAENFPFLEQLHRPERHEK
jgi:hypothetical protein